MPISIDDIPVVTPATPVKESDIYYASNLAGGDVLNNYVSAIQEVSMTGDSQLVNQEKTKWVQEQQDRNRMTAEEIISDSSIPVETRRKVAEAYVQEAIPMQDLRTKFMIDAAVRDISKTVEDREAQDALADTLLQRDQEKINAEKQRAIEEGKLKLSSILDGVQKTVGTFASGLAVSIPAGLVGVASLVFNQDPEKAAEFIKFFQERYTYTPEGSSKSDELSREVTAWLAEKAEQIDVPFKWVGDQVLSITKEGVSKDQKENAWMYKEGASPDAFAATMATGAYLASGGLVGSAIVKGAGAVRGVIGKPKVRAGTPMDTIETASKEQANNMAARAIADDSERIAKAAGTTKEQILNTYVLPKIEEEFGPINPDVRVTLNALDKKLYSIVEETELNAHVYPVSQILSEREMYLNVLTETERPHLLLSSSVLDIPAEAKLFGRGGKGYEALVDSTANKLEGTAVFGRNANFGYKTPEAAAKYMKKLQESTKHLPDPGTFNLLEKDGQFYVSWKFTREYVPHDSLAFGDDVLSAHLFSKNVDISTFANGSIGRQIFPAYMRMKEEIPTTGAAAAREEARIESAFLQEARDTFMKTKHPKELVASLRQGEELGKVYTANDIQMQHPHLSKAETDALHGEYVAYRRIVDHLYVMADRVVRKKLVDKNMKTLYNNKGEFVIHATEPLKEIPEGVTRVYDLSTKEVVAVNKNLPVIQMERPIQIGDHIVSYAHLPKDFKFGPIRAGALPKIPGYIPRMYKEWFVVDKVPRALWVDGKKVGHEELRNYKKAVAMAGTRSELEDLMVRMQKEDPNATYLFRREEKDINDKIIHDSEVYDTYLKEVHRRGDRLPSLDRPAEIEDVMVALTKTIRSVSKVTAWDDLNKVRRDNFVKAYGDFTNHKFPSKINDIVPKRHMTPKEERDFLAAQSVYTQMEREQIASTQSDVIWKSGLNKVADLFEKHPNVDAHILREWGEKGFIPARAVKAIGSNIWLYWRVLRMWAVQPQQWKELVLVSPSYAKHLNEIVPVTYGLLSRTQTLRGLRSHSDSVGRRIVPDYDRVIAALEESGIVQSVDMNQMVHGIWKDAVQELDPKATKSVLEAMDKTLEVGSKTVAFPGKVGRALGYNPSELTNQVSLWLYARLRWMEKNPGKNWDTPENRATIAREQSLYSHMSSTRAGMYGWQDGMISTFTQFVAIPWKSSLQVLSMKQFTGAEKARLAAARLFWYGKYGLPLGYVVHQTLENNLEDQSSREQFNAWTVSATDRIWNATLGAMFDEEGEHTSVDTRNLATSIDGEYVWNVLHTSIEMAKGNPVDFERPKFPFENATGSLYETVRTVHDIFKLNENGFADEETWRTATWKAVSFAGTLSDFNKAMLAEGISKSGNSNGYQQTRGEAIARLFGVPPSEETLYNMTTVTQIKRRKEVQNLAKQIHQRVNAVLQAKGVDEEMKQKEYYDTLGAFLMSVPPYYKEEIITEIFKLDNMSQREKKESILLNIYRNHNDVNDNRYIEMRNALEKSNDPQIKSMLKDLESYKKRSIK